MISVRFSKHFSSSNANVKLLELNHAVMEALSMGDKVIIKGDAKKPATLCTSNKTFSLQQVRPPTYI